MGDALLSEIRVVNFRSARQLVLRPGPVCAFIGEPGAGKSNLLFALRALLDPGFDLSTADVTVGERAISIEATLADGAPSRSTTAAAAPPIVHFPTALRGGDLVSATAGSPSADAVHALIREALARAPAPRVALVAGSRPARPDLGRRLRDRGAGAVPRPAGAPLPAPADPAARRERQPGLLHDPRPGLLSVAALDEVNLVGRDELGVTAVERLRPIDVDDEFRVMCEFDAERAELFFSRAAILVEGMTEKIALPFVFHALGHDADREQISIVECGGKSNLPLFVEICRRARVPCVVVHDSDLRPGREPLDPS